MSLLMVSQQTFAQKADLFAKDSLDVYIQRAMDEWRIPGVAVAIVKDGKIAHQKAYGYGNWDTKTPININTAFPLASVSKTFTGTLFAILDADDLVSLNDPIKKWLPNFRMKDKSYEDQLLIADILSHRSGWKTFQGDFINTESSLSFSEMIERFGQITPAYPLRTRFGYSNFGFMIAGQVIPAATNKSFNAYLDERILTPLKMDRTLVYGDDIENDTNIVLGHTIVNDSLIVLPPDKIEPYSHGGLYSSIGDLTTWMSVLLDKGEYNSTSVIPESAINKMWLSHTITGKGRAADREFYLKTYGLGWEIMQYNGVEVISHGGAYSGALTMVALVPELNLGVAILTNQDDHMLQETLRWQIIDAFMGREAPNYTQNTIEFQRRRKAEAKLNKKNDQVVITPFSVAMESIIGSYECDSYGLAQIKKANGKYILSLEHHPSIIGTLTQLNSDELLCSYNHPMFGNMAFPFVIENGNVTSFTLFVDPFIEMDGYEFRRID